MSLVYVLSASPIYFLFISSTANVMYGDVLPCAYVGITLKNTPRV